MRDNELFALIITIIDTLKGNYGLDDIEVYQSNQPTAQGVAVGPAAYISKIPMDHRYGSVYRKDTWDQEEGVMVHQELQVYESTFQLEALVTQSPETPEAMTASDVANYLAALLQSSAAIRLFRASDVGILRITDIRNVPFINDREQFQFAPSFDFTLTHKQITLTTEPVVESIELQIYRV